MAYQSQPGPCEDPYQATARGEVFSQLPNQLRNFEYGLMTSFELPTQDENVATAYSDGFPAAAAEPMEDITWTPLWLATPLDRSPGL